MPFVRAAVDGRLRVGQTCRHPMTSTVPALSPAPSFLGIKPGWPKRALIVAALLAPLAAAILIDAPMCPTAATFGIPCPGCGLTRATLAALHGQLATAYHLHPLVFLVTPVYAFVIGSLSWGYVRGGVSPLPSKRASLIASIAAFVFLVLVVGVWISRFFGAFGGPVPVKMLGEKAPSQTLNRK